MYQENIHIFLNECKVMDEKHAWRDTHTYTHSKEEQVPARNTNDAILSDQLDLY